MRRTPIPPILTPVRTRALLLTFGLLALAPAQAQAATFFQSPSGNIGCVISTTGARCDIAEKSWRPPPKPASCPVDWGNGLEVSRRGKASFTCAGDTTLGMGRKLAYGKVIRAGRFRCASLQSGVRCVNRLNGHGFGLSRHRARRF